MFSFEYCANFMNSFFPKKTSGRYLCPLQVPFKVITEKPFSYFVYFNPSYQATLYRSKVDNKKK